jgi:hypothetical protein
LVDFLRVFSTKGMSRESRSAPHALPHARPRKNAKKLKKSAKKTQKNGKISRILRRIGSDSRASRREVMRRLLRWQHHQKSDRAPLAALARELHVPCSTLRSIVRTGSIAKRAAKLNERSRAVTTKPKLTSTKVKLELKLRTSLRSIERWRKPARDAYTASFREERIQYQELIGNEEYNNWLESITQ